MKLNIQLHSLLCLHATHRKGFNLTLHQHSHFHLCRKMFCFNRNNRSSLLFSLVLLRPLYTHRKTCTYLAQHRTQFVLTEKDIDGGCSITLCAFCDELTERHGHFTDRIIRTSYSDSSYRLDDPGFESGYRQENYLFSIRSSVALGPTHWGWGCFPEAQQPRREAGHQPQSSTKAKKASSYLPLPYLPSRRVQGQCYIYFTVFLSFFQIEMSLSDCTPISFSSYQHQCARKWSGDVLESQYEQQYLES